MGTAQGRVSVSPVKKEAGTDTKAQKLNRIPKYQVYLVNDDYTPMDFVIVVLQQFFGMNFPYAVKIMLEVHHNGRAVCGVYTRDIAETKVALVNEFARMNEHPLLCKMEKL